MYDRYRVSSILAFFFSLCVTFTTASAVNLDPSTHQAIPGDFNGDGRIDALLQPLTDAVGGALLLQDGTGALSVVAQGWDPGYLGLDWSAGKSAITTADLNGDGLADVVIQPRKTGGNAAVLITDPTVQLLKVTQVIPANYLGLDWSSAGHLIVPGDFDGDRQQELLLQAATPGTPGAIVHADPSGHLVAVTQAIPDGYLGRSWDAQDVTLYVGDFNGDGRQDLLMQLKAAVPPANQARYALLLADANGQFTQVNQSWTDTAFGADWSPTTHTLSVQTINGVTSIVLTAKDSAGSNYVFQANGSGVFDKPAARWTGTKSAADALKSQAAGQGISVAMQPATAASATKTASTAPVHTLAMAMAVGNGPVAATTVGSSGGQGGASGGTATYSIPIVVPPGRAGMQPSLSLSYSSRGGNGEVGMGWSLAGQSAIRLCPETVAEDGIALGVSYSSTDRLCLDGQRLVAWNGAYGADGTTYRTELDSYVRITEHGAINSPQSSFEVDYKDGRQAFYGYNSSNSAQNSMLFALVPSGGGLTTPLEWAEGCEEDRSSNNIGNNIVYNYSYPGAGGELHLHAIYYTGTGCGTSAVDGNQAVTFTYSTRTDTSVTLLAGGATYQTQLLTGITTYAGSNSARQYSLSYSQSGATNRSLLQSVQECGYDSARNQACLPATTFTWQNSPETYTLQHFQVPDNSQYASLGGDYAGNGRRAVIFSGNGIGNITIVMFNPDGSVLQTINAGSLFSQLDGMSPDLMDVDLNHDGIADIVGVNGGKVAAGSWYGGSTFSVNPTDVNAVSEFHVADMNGDGWPDIIQLEPEGNGTNGVYVHENTNPRALQFDTKVKAADLTGTENSFSLAGDLTGSGLPDIFIEANGHIDHIMIPNVTAGGALSFSSEDPTQVDSTHPGIGITDAMQRDQHFFMDINGDGLPDFVYSDGSNWYYMLNLGQTAKQPINFAPPVNAGVDYRPAASVQAAGTLQADIDNDGAEELVYPATMVDAFCPLVPPGADNNNRTYSVNACFGGSIYSGVAAPASEDYSIYKYDAIKFVFQANGQYQTALNTNTGIVAQAQLAQAGDVEGSGLTQIFSPFSIWFTGAKFSDDRGNTLYDYPPSIGLAGLSASGNVNATGNFANAAPDMMQSATDGLGVTSSWDYYPLSTPMQYSLPNASTPTTPFYYAPAAGSSNRYADNDSGNNQNYVSDGLGDYIYFTSSMYVVGDYNVTNGVGGTNTHDFLYSQAIYNTQGRGFQGFYGVVDIFLPAGGSPSTDLRTVQLYHQHFPLSGQLMESWTEPNGNALDMTKLGPLPATDTSFYEHVVNTSACHVGQGAPWTASTGYKVDGVLCTQDMDAHTYWPFVSQSVVTKQGTAFDYMSTTTKTADYDPDGNYTSGSTQVSDNSGTYTETDADTYTVDEPDWWLDQLTDKSVTEQTQYNTPLIPAANGSITRTVNYDYYQDGSRKLKDEFADPGTCEKDTAYTYDGFGNPASVTVSSGSTVAAVPAGTLSNGTCYAFASRTGKTVYDSDGYFLNQAVNALGQATTYNSWDAASGQPTQVTDPNGVPTSYAYDAFGRKVQETDGPLPTINIGYVAPHDSTTLGTTPANAAYAVNTTQSGYPGKTAYYDQFNRSVGTGVTGFNGNTPSVETQYDALGRVTAVSEPFNYGGTPVWNTTTYDVLDRPRVKMDAEGVQTSYVYGGLTTTITTAPGDASYGSASNRVDIETRNGLGKLLSVENGSGGGTGVDGTTLYGYGPQGNPLVIQDAAGHQILATYNPLGQKTAVSDPDQGTSSYAYDVLGEVLQQTDAKNQQIRMQYDPLGRMTSRLQPESATPTTWCYDSPACASPGTAPYIGKLYSVTQYDGYSETYSYDQFGRPTNQHTVIGGTGYDTSTSYDGSGHVGTVTYPASYPDTAPVSNSGPNQGVQLGSGGSVSVTLNGSGSGAANVTYGTLYTWTQVSCPSASGPQVALSNANAINPTFTATVVANYCFNLTVSDGFVATTSNVQVTVEPGLPGTPAAQSESNTKLSVIGDINLAWGASAGANYYRLYESINGAAVNQIGPNPTANSDPLTGKGSLSANNTYSYAVEGCANNGICGPVSGLSNGVEVTLAPLPPASVSVPASSNWDGSFTVSWPASTTGVVTGYYADVGYSYDDPPFGKQWQDAGHCSTVSSNIGQLSPPAPATSCTVPGNQNSMPSLAGTNYSYVVKLSACNDPTSSGTGTCGNTVTGGPVNVWYLPPPAAPSLSSTTTSSVDGNYTLSWTVPSGPISYYVLQESYANAGFPNPTGWGMPWTAKSFSKYNKGTWYYRSQACNQAGCGAWSNVVQVNVTGPAGPTVTLVTTNGHVLGNSVTANWSSSATATSYQLLAQYCMPGCGNYGVVYNGTALTYRDVAPTNAVTGNYFAVACNNAGCNGGYGVAVQFNYGGCHTCASLAPSNPAPAPVTNSGPGTLAPSSGSTPSAPATPPTPAPAITAPATSSGPGTLAPSSGSAPPAPAGGPTASVLTPLSVPAEMLSALPEPILAPAPRTVPARMAMATRQRPRGAPVFDQPIYKAWANARVMPASGTQTLARLQVQYHYDGAGYLDQLYNAIYPSQVFWTANALDLFGQVVNETYGNGVTTSLITETTGRITQITSTSGAATIQNDTYSWYHVGNLHTRAWQAGSYNPSETFSYDPLNRLTGASLAGTSAAQAPVSYAYDALGNITSKSDAGTYSYGGPGPHAVTAVAGTVNGITNPVYGYDADGNMTNRAGTAIAWNSLNLPSCIDAAGGNCTSGPNYSAFSYAPDKHRYQQTAMVNGVAETTTYVGGVDMVTTGGITHYKHRISAYGKDILTLDWKSDGSTPVYTYEHPDHLGGVDAVTDINGAIVVNNSVTTAFSYGAFGNRRDPQSGGALSAATLASDRSSTHRGFTNHEMLDGVDIIHMNGRVYDPTIGRMLSVDPVVQAPTNGQSLNPYSYVMNNPLSLTDPTGYTAACGDVSTSTSSSGMCSVTVGDKTTYVSYSVSSKGDVRLDTGDAQHAASMLQGANSSSSPQGANSLKGNGADSTQSALSTQNKPSDTASIGSPSLVARSGSAESSGAGATGGGPDVSTDGSGDGGTSDTTQSQYDTSIEQSGFKTPHDAARAMGQKYEDSSVKDHQEYQAGIVKVGDANYGYVKPITGAPGATVVNIRGYSDAIYAKYGDAYVAFAHTHFDSNENFSPYDVEFATHFPLYLYNTNHETRLLNQQLINNAVRGEPGAGYENRLRSYMNDNGGMPGDCIYGCH